MAFTIYLYTPNEREPQRQASFETIEDCFDFLSENGHPVEFKYLLSINSTDQTLVEKDDGRFWSIVYDSAGSVRDDADKANLAAFQSKNTRFVYIRQENVTNLDEENFSWEQLVESHTAWSGRKMVRKSFLKTLSKIFHPGNSLTLAVVLTAIGIGLIGFGVACPPALVFAALAVAAFSVVSAIVYAGLWLKRDWDEWKTLEEAQGRELSLGKYLELSLQLFEFWVKKHPIQTKFMIAGAVLFLGTLIVTTCGLAGVPVFAFMTAGVFGGAIGLVSSFFSAGLSGIPALAGVATLLVSVFAGAALIVGPTNILDTIRRAIGGFFRKKDDDAAAAAPEDAGPPLGSEVACANKIKDAVESVGEGISNFWKETVGQVFSDQKGPESIPLNNMNK